MAYVLVEDFRGGLDTRRTVVTSVPGTLVVLTNGHLTRGGEIEKRRAFVKVCDLPSGTHGLAAAAGQIYVFGGAAKSSLTFPSDTPNNLNYIQFEHPDATPEDMTKMLGADFFNGKVYGAAQYADGRIYHYWEGQDDSTGRTRAPRSKPKHCNARPLPSIPEGRRSMFPHCRKQ